MPLKITPDRLNRNVRLGFDKMAHFRKSRLSFMRQYVTRLYQASRGDQEGSKANPLQLMFNATTTLVPNLVYHDPQSRVTSNFMAFRPYAEVLELALNHLVREINLRNTLRMAITDAVFSCGWIKTGLGVSGQTLDMDGELKDVGQPYADRVDPDDMVIDPLARQPYNWLWIGNAFETPAEMLADSGLFDPDLIMSLADSGDDHMKRAASLSGGNPVEAQDLGRMIRLVEIYIPEDGRIVTIPAPDTGPQDVFLREVDYEGPERGPYHQLGFSFVPDNIMPVAPAMVWYDLHMLANRVARKVARQAERMKTVLAFEPVASDSAQAIVDSDDGESVAVENIESIKEITYGGPNQDAYQYLNWAGNAFAEAAMNLDLLSGNQTGEATATQAEMLQANTSVRLADMQNMVYDFAGAVMKDLAFFLHTDPLIEMPLVKRKAGQDEQVFYTPEMREGDFLDYAISVVPMSMARQDPNVKVRRLMEFIGSGVPALASAYQMLGPAFNLEQALLLIGREMGIKELDEIINSPLLQMQMDRMFQAFQLGIPIDPKAMGLGAATGGSPVMGLGPPTLPGGVRPGQPNPGANTAMGTTPTTERNQRRQETAGELQGAYPSVSQLATAR
jgi:hypothetical protein